MTWVGLRRALAKILGGEPINSYPYPHASEQEALRGDWRRVGGGLSEPIAVNSPVAMPASNVIPLRSMVPTGPEALSEDFGDPIALLNSREWLQKSLEARGARITGGGVGGGQADLDFELDGCRFNVSIRPR
jgi:hypothetical protein